MTRYFTQEELAAIEGDASSVYYEPPEKLTTPEECLHWATLTVDLARELYRQQDRRQHG